MFFHNFLKTSLQVIDFHYASHDDRKLIKLIKHDMQRGVNKIPNFIGNDHIDWGVFDCQAKNQHNLPCSKKLMRKVK